MDTAERYLRFAAEEARHSSPTYEQLANFVANDTATLALLNNLPTAQRQPNLLFGAVRLLSGKVPEVGELSALVQQQASSLTALMLNRRTQTNEPGRTATLLPLLSQIPGPIALVEVGASAGLCLLPDHYAFQYNACDIISPKSLQQAPLFKCTANAATPIPNELPEICWRRGIDINPLDPTNQDDMQWLETLIWPEHTSRLENFKKAVNIAARIKPRVDAGDLLIELKATIAHAPAGATLVIFHSAVLSYLSADARLQFRNLIEDINCIWISNEDHRLLPDITEKTTRCLSPDKFLLSMNGQPIAETGPHGQTIDWLTH